MTIKWAEVLEAKGVDVAHIAAVVKAAENRLQAEQRVLHEQMKPVAGQQAGMYGPWRLEKKDHDPEMHGLSLVQVEALVKGMLGSVEYEFCGKELAAEIFEEL